MPNGCAVDVSAQPGLVAAAGDLDRLAPPLVLKAYGAGIVHKSDIGAVRLGLASAREVAGAVREMHAALAARGITPDGWYVEEQALPGVEMIVGVVADPVFGAVLLAGLGGVWTEALADTALRICPVTEADAVEMLSGLRGRAVLSGLRGQPPADLGALVRVLLAVGGRGGVAETLSGALAEFELNPVICTAGGAVAVDARLMLAPGAALPGARTGPAATTPVTGTRPAPAGTRLGAAGTDFTRLFAPRGIAVAGASTRRPGFGNMFLRFYRRAGYRGKLFAIHPQAAEIDGVPAVASLADVRGQVDYALVAVPASRCAEVVASAAGIGFVQVMSGGFRETGGEGAKLEDDLAAAARGAGARLLGPNCMGVYSPAGGQTFIGGEPGEPGRITVISQSGGMAGEIIRSGEHRGLRFAAVATVGNSADVTPAELLRWFGSRGPASGTDPVSAAGLYLEDPRDGRDLLAALRDVRGRLPVVALVGGRSRQGQRAAASHTGGMVTDARVWTALEAQAAITLVTSQDDLIGVLDFFDQQAGRLRPTEAAPGVLVIGPSGGASVLAADAFDAAGVPVPALAADARDALTALGLGAGSSLANPLEVPVGPGGRAALIGDAVTAVCAQHS
jgi:acyl-CoA synthetase (NDP forming)